MYSTDLSYVKQQKDQQEYICVEKGGVGIPNKIYSLLLTVLGFAFTKDYSLIWDYIW